MNFFNKIILLITCLVINIYSWKGFKTIGILSNPYPLDHGDYTTGLIYDTFVRWIESSGSIVIPIHVWYSYEKIDYILSKVNGIILQGSHRNLKFGQPFERIAKYIFERVVELNEKFNVTMPLWGTCQGLQLLHSLVMDKIELDKYDSNAYIAPLIFPDMDLVKKSRSFKYFTEEELEAIQTKNITVHYHNLGIRPELYNELNHNMSDFFNVIALAKDRNGKVFVDIAEAKNSPIFAFQHHTEERINEISKDEPIEDNFIANVINQKFLFAFMEYVNKNNNIMTYDELVQLNYIDSYLQHTVIVDNNHYYMFTLTPNEVNYTEIRKQRTK